MLNDEICKKRDELNKSIENNDDYDKIYKISVELDELIAKYYMQADVHSEGNVTKEWQKYIFFDIPLN